MQLRPGQAPLERGAKGVARDDAIDDLDGPRAVESESEQPFGLSRIDELLHYPLEHAVAHE